MLSLIIYQVNLNLLTSHSVPGFFAHELCDVFFEANKSILLLVISNGVNHLLSRAPDSWNVFLMVENLTVERVAESFRPFLNRDDMTLSG